MATAQDQYLQSQDWDYSAQSGWTFNGTLTPVTTPISFYDFSAGTNANDKQGSVEFTEFGLNPTTRDVSAIPSSAFINSSNPANPSQGLNFRMDITALGANGPQNVQNDYQFDSLQSEIWEYVDFIQPINFYHHVQMIVTTPVNSLNVSADWQVGDTVESSDQLSGVNIYGKIWGVDAASNKLYLTDTYWNFSNPWKSGRTVTNTRSGASFVSENGIAKSSNNKFMTLYGDIYSYGGMIMETVAKSPYDGGVLGNSYLRPTLNRAIQNGSEVNPPAGDLTNLVNGGENPVVFDRNDNGKRVEFVCHRKRATNLNSSDGEYSLYRKVEGGAWQRIYHATGLSVFNENTHNSFEKGKWIGAQNSRFDETTSFWLLKMGWYISKPTFLNGATDL